MGGTQAALIIALRIARQRLIYWPMTLMAALSACLLAAGVLRHYFDIYTHHTVRGISFIFVGIDAAGDLFSLVSVCKTSCFRTREVDGWRNGDMQRSQVSSVRAHFEYSRDGYLWHRAHSLDWRLRLRWVLQLGTLAEEAG